MISIPPSLPLSTRLKRTRTALGKTQTQLAVEIGVQRATINRIEGVGWKPRTSTLMLIETWIEHHTLSNEG